MAGKSAASASLQSQPLVIRQSRHYVLYWVAAGAGALALALSGYGGTNLVDGVMTEAQGLTYIAYALFFIAVIAWARAGRLTLTSAGLRYRTMFGSRFYRWNEVAGVHSTTSRGKQGEVSITLSKGRPLRLAGRWPVSRDDLERTIRQARREWGR